MNTLRSAEGQKTYDDYLATLDKGRCVLCEKVALPGKQFEHWKIVVNDFPYDVIADKHDMIVPLRHVEEPELTVGEWKELLQLKGTVLNDEYDYLLEATHKGKSIPSHFHLHLVTAK